MGLAHARLTRRSSSPYSTSSLTSYAATALADAPDAQALIDTDSVEEEQDLDLSYPCATALVEEEEVVAYAL